MESFFELRSHSYLFTENDEDNEGEEEDGDLKAETADLILSPIPVIFWLFVSFTCVIICTRNLIEHIKEIKFDNAKMFTAFILFPFLGNMTDYIQACLVASKSLTDITILVTLGSSMQILLFTLPFLVVLGWIIHEPMTLQFGLFELVATVIGVFVINLSLVGRRNYLLGITYIAV